MSKRGGNSREWGYASYDVDKSDDYSDSNLQYTSYEKSGAVNRYRDNGDNGHSHDYYKSSDNYNSGGDSDVSRSESNGSSNPSIGEVQDNGGCYLTTACMQHFAQKFDDNCEELTLLRYFRDIFVCEEDVEHYYKTAPVIVEAINESYDCKAVYDSIYNYVIIPCVNAIKSKNYSFAYERYKTSILALEEKYARSRLEKQFSRVLCLTLDKNRR